MSEKKESVSNKKISRRSLLKWTGALAGAVAVGVGAGYETDQLLRPITTVTETATQPLLEEQRGTIKTTGGAVSYSVKNGRIVRIEPLSYEEAKTWKISAGGHTFSPARKNLVRNWALTYRRYIYSPQRIGYPMKRVTYNPGHGGENSGDRAKNEFVRISWEEALTIVVNELKRMKGTYGNSAICAWTPSHHEYGVVHYTGLLPRFMRCFGGYTVRQTMDHSWVGWQAGGVFTWGYDQGCDAADSGSDTLQNSKMVVYWSRDPVNVLLYEGYDRSLPWYSWIKSMGIKQIVISPNCHETAVGWADKWLPVYPVTDNALAAAIAYTWIKEGTLDQKYLDTHTVGFDEEHLPPGAPANSSFKSYILGVADGVPKTPEWAEKICGVKAREIRALAREWASGPTTTVNTGGTGGAACRTAYGHEWCRMMITLQAMQGLGKPGVQMISDFSPPKDARHQPPANYGPGGMEWLADKKTTNPIQQVIQYVLFDKSILNPPVSWTGGNKLSAGVTAPNFLKYTYPMAGYSEIKMFYMDGGSIAAIAPECGRFIKVFLSSKIEFVVSQNFRWDAGTKYSDLILPACTGFERNEIVPNPGNDLVAIYDKGIQPLMESKSDLDIYNLLAQRLGIAKDFNEGNSEEDWAKKMFAKTNIPVTYDEFKKKGYYVFEIPDDYKPLTPTPGMGWYYGKPNGEGLATPTGKIEIFSTILFSHYGVNDPEIPQVPKYISAWEGRYDPIAAKYPLQMLTEHPKYRYHEQFNEVSWFRGFYKIRGSDGYEYEPIQINPVDAQARGIKNNDIVRVFNDRAQILCAVKLTERVRPGVVNVWYASRSDLQNTADPTSLDKGGSANLLTSARPMSKHAMCVGFNAMVQVERWRS